MKLGKKPARLGAVKMRMSNYVDTAYLARKFGITKHSNVGQDHLVKDWGMLGNDQVGDCVIAGIFHAIMLWNAMRGRKINISTARCIETYSALTGYVPGKEDTDNGTDMTAAADHLRMKGFVDDDNIPHKIEAYIGLHPGDYLQHMVAIKLFGCAAVGIRFPNSAWKQFNSKKPWTKVPAGGFDGGHYILATGESGPYMRCVTWGRIQQLNEAFLMAYEDECQAYLSFEMIDPTKPPVEGFDKESLLNDLAMFTRRTVDQVIAEAQIAQDVTNTAFA